MDEQVLNKTARTFLQQLCADIGCSFEDLLKVMDNRRVARESQENPCYRPDMMMMTYKLPYLLTVD